MYPVGQPSPITGGQASNGTLRVEEERTASRSPRGDILDIQGGPEPEAPPPATAEPAEDPLVASFKALQRWAQSASCASVSDSGGFDFRDFQTAFFAPRSLPNMV